MASTTIDTPVGPFTIVAREQSVLASGFTTDMDALLALVHPRLRPPRDADLDLITKATRSYFDGDLSAIDEVEVEQQTAGAFLGHAWDVLRTVPAGEPITYTGYAARAGRPAAVRAAAAACARNAVALFVPCHRVVRTDGGLGGYRYGIDIKEWLLAHERQIAETRS
jgi:methylated-DNA-[protein]-cysteine S-methyltransferase